MVKAFYCSGPFEVAFTHFDVQNAHQNLQLLIILGQLLQSLVGLFSLSVQWGCF